MPLEYADLLSVTSKRSLNGVRVNWTSLFPYSVRRVVPVDAVIFDAADRPDYIWYVERGLVKLVILNHDGKEQGLLFVGPGRTFGEAAAFDDHPYRITSIAHKPSVVHCIPCEVMLQKMKIDNDLLLAMVKSLSVKIRDLASQIEGITLMSPRNRVQFALLRLCGTCGINVGGSTIGLPLTHSDIAAFTHLSRVTVTRVMKELKNEGLVENRRNLVLVQEARLREIASSLAPE